MKTTTLSAASTAKTAAAAAAAVQLDCKLVCPQDIAAIKALALTHTGFGGALKRTRL